MKRVLKYTSSAMMAGLCVGAPVAVAQDVTFQARLFDNTALGGTATDPFDDIQSFSSATSSFLIGNQPISIAYDGANLYVGGNLNGSAARVAVAEISDFFGTQGAKNVPGSDIPGNQMLGGQGYSGMDWSDEFGLVATVDRNSTSPLFQGNPLAPFAQVLLWKRNNPADFSTSLQGFGEGIRGVSGPAFDYGFDGGGFTLSNGMAGPAIAVPVLGRGGPFGIDPTSFDPFDDLYTPDTALYSLFIPGQPTEWRDYDIHPDNGLVVGRSGNLAILGDRTQFNGTTNLRVITPPGGQASFQVNQNVEIIHNPACGVEMIVLNDRPAGSVLVGDFFSRVLLYDLNGNPLTYEILLPDGTPADAQLRDTSNIYSFFWSEPDQILFVCDGINRVVYALDLVCSTGGCNVADIAEPFNSLDFNDINAFVTAFLGMDALADLNNDMMFDFNDINAFVTDFLSGCP